MTRKVSHKRDYLPEDLWSFRSHAARISELRIGKQMEELEVDVLVDRMKQRRSFLG